MAMRRTLLAGLGVVALLFAVLQVPLAAAPGEAASREIAKAATVVYVSLRAVNAALSFAQEIEVGVSAVASGTTQPLKVLEPIDDTIERIAAVVFSVAALSWVLSVAFQPLSSLGFLAAGLGLLGLALAQPWPKVRAHLAALVRTGLLFALVLPLLYAGGTGLGRLATSGVEASAMARLDSVATEARTMIGRAGDGAETQAPADGGFLDRMWGGVSGARDQAGRFANAADYYWTNADAVLEAAFVLIAVFVLQMVILPGALLVLLWRLALRLP